MAEAKKCLYDVLSVTPDATEAELKKAFRVAALQYHPDKNRGREAEAEEQFKLVQEAQDVLLNPESREWYDAHRNQILRGEEPGEAPIPADATETDLFAHLESPRYEGYHDGARGFYAVYAELFGELGREEMFFAGRDVSLSFAPFGASTSEWHFVKAFYDEWLDFSSVKKFTFAEKWDLSEAQNRMHRRLMDKENKRASTKAKKEFNNSVRQLVLVLQKRDPRVKRQKKIEEKEKEEREQLRKLREVQQAELRKQRAKDARIARDQALEEDAEALDAILAGIELDEKLERRKARKKSAEAQAAAGDSEGDSNQHGVSSDEDMEVIDEEELYCQACKKKFRTPAQVRNHQTSKKHVQAAARLRRELEEDDEIFFDARDSEEIIIDTNKPPRNCEVVENFEEEVEEEPIVQEEMPVEEEVEDEIVDIYATSNKKKKKKAKKRQQQAFFANEPSANDKEAPLEKEEATENNSDAQDVKKPQMSKKAKRREREKRKAEELKAANGDSSTGSHKCNVCSEQFTSRSKLMKHVEKLGHARKST